MRSYLLYSSSAHFLLLAGLFLLSRNSVGLQKKDAYYIDFIGPAQVVTMQKAALAEGREAAAPAAAKAPKNSARAAKPDPEDFAQGALPKPSVLAGGGKLFEEEKRAPAGENGTPVIMDSANFPYPWYITQVRELLWNAWTARMPSGGDLRCTVRFSILRDGTVKSVGLEKSSGNRLFDNAAESSVEGAGPFPALPEDFYEDQLTAHVEFKAMD